MPRLMLVIPTHGTIKFLAQSVYSAGCTHCVAYSGDQAWQMIEADEVFDLIVFYHKLPDCNGLSFLKKLREQRPANKTVFIFMGTNADSDTTKSIEDLGAIYVGRQSEMSLNELINTHLSNR